MLKYAFIITALLLCGIGFRVCAQPGVGATYIGDYSTMSSGRVLDKDMANGNWVYRLANLKGGKYTFKVTMIDGSVITVKSRIYADSIRNQSYLVDNDASHPNQKYKVYCNQTRQIICVDKGITGMATDTCWMFKVVEGNINAYSFLPEIDGPFSLLAIQTGATPPESFLPALLEPMVKNDNKAYKAFEKHNYFKAIQIYNESHK